MKFFILLTVTLVGLSWGAFAEEPKTQDGAGKTCTNGCPGPEDRGRLDEPKLPEEFCKAAGENKQILAKSNDACESKPETKVQSKGGKKGSK